MSIPEDKQERTTEIQPEGSDFGVETGNVALPVFGLGSDSAGGDGGSIIGTHNTDSRRRGYTQSDLGNAERFISMHGDKVRWLPARKLWFLYDGMRWAPDERGHVVKLAHQTARSIFEDAAHETVEAKQKEIAKFAVASQNKIRIDGMLSQAKPYLAVGMGELDREPWDLNCKSGTLDLRTGELRPHDPGDLITRLVPVAYDLQAACPRFTRFLKEVLVDDDVVSFMKRYAGYTLTGITRERLFAILHGSGKNGKSTLVEILHDVMGDYATNTDTETILAKRNQGVGNDVAALKGARFVSAAEVENGRRLAESKVKQLTGTDTVTARFLFGEPFDFRPAFKLWLSTNNKPVIQGTDDAIWDRIRLVPFEQRFEGGKADLELPEKLKDELPGILAWMVEGCLEWQEHGLGAPDSVVAATDQYRSEMDTLAAFIEDRCVIRPDATAQATPLYQQYRMWCDSAGEHADTQKTFGMRLTERGFESGRASSGVNKGRKIWRGIGLLLDADPPDEADDRSPGEPSADDRSPDESGIGMGDTAGFAPSSEQSEPTNHKVLLDIPRVREEYRKRFTSFTSFTDEEKAAGESNKNNANEDESDTVSDSSVELEFPSAVRGLGPQDADVFSTLEALKDYGQYGAKSDEWKEMAFTRSVERPKFYEARKKLLDLDLVHKVKDKYFVNSRGSQLSEAREEPND